MGKESLSRTETPANRSLGGLLFSLFLFLLRNPTGGLAERFLGMRLVCTQDPIFFLAVS